MKGNFLIVIAFGALLLLLTKKGPTAPTVNPELVALKSIPEWGIYSSILDKMTTSEIHILYLAVQSGANLSDSLRLQVQQIFNKYGIVAT